MNSKQTNASNSTDLIKCAFCNYGCSDSFPRNQLSTHYSSQQHIKSLVKYIVSKEIVYDEALIDLAMNPIEMGMPLTAAAITVNHSQQFFGTLSHAVIGRNIQQSNVTDVASISSTNFNSIYQRIDSSARRSLEQRDRMPNHSSNPLVDQEESQLNTIAMQELANRSASLSLSPDEHVDHHLEQNENPPLIQQTPDEADQTLEFLRDIESNSKSVSTDGCLIWRIPNIDQIIHGTRCHQLFMNSPVFETSMNGHRLSVSFYPNGSGDRRFMSIYVHLNFPVHASFSGTIKFLLLDQSKNQSLQHHIQSCSGEITAVNQRLGLDHFIEQWLIHKADNLYVDDDDNHSICLIISITQTAEQKFANQSRNIQDALMCLQQKS